MTTEPFPLVVIIVVNWNNHSDTLECLDSLRNLDYEPYEVVLIDNGSDPDDLEALRQGCGQVRLVEHPVNEGYVGGNNAGLLEAETLGAKFALLLNNDTVVAPDFLTHLVRSANADDSIAVAGPTIYYYSDRDLIWSAGGAIDWHRGQASMIGIGRRQSEAMDRIPHDVDFVTGCALLARMEAIAAVGPLDPRFFAYYEEVEWCVRMARAGHRIIHVPQAKVWHKISRDPASPSPIVHYYMTRNRLLFLSLCNPGLRAWVMTLLVDDLRTLCSWTLRPRWRHLSEHRTMMLKAISDFFARRFGAYGQRIGS